MNNDELRKRVAQELGYKLTKNDEQFFGLKAPDGSVITGNVLFSAEYAWENAGSWPESVDVALTLPIGKQAHWLLRFNVFTQTWVAYITDIELHGQYAFSSFNESLAVAICEAWLAYREGQKPH